MNVKEKKRTELRRQVSDFVRSLPYPKMRYTQRVTLAINALPDFLEYPILLRCDIVGLNERTYYHVMNSATFHEFCDDFLAQVWRKVRVEMQTRYIMMARSGQWRQIERILEQTKGLDRVEAPGITVNVSQQQITEKITENRRIGMERMGYSLVETDSDT